jgi:hypothetical protein
MGEQSAPVNRWVVCGELLAVLPPLLGLAELLLLGRTGDRPGGRAA